MIYKLTFDMDLIDESIKNNENYIYAEKCNIDEIEANGIKKGFFDKIILKKDLCIDWPDIEFYYSSKVSNKESDYLLNIKRWPIIHARVKEKLEINNIKGIKFYPIKLIDVCTQEVNRNFFVIYIENFIDAFDMDKSSYKYNEKYDVYTFIPQQTFMNLDVCRKYDIFRADKSVAGIYVSDKMCNILKNNFVGFKFDEQK